MNTFKVKKLAPTYQYIVDLVVSAESRGRLPNTLLFHGPKETSKHLIIQTVTEKLLLTNQINSHPDKILLQPENEQATIGIEETRAFIESFSSTPLVAEKKVGIILQAENLTRQSQNSLLKILEEPPQHSILILLSDSEHSLLQTILSRVTKIFVPLLGSTEYKSSLQDNRIKNPPAIFHSYCAGRIERTIRLQQDAERVALGEYAHGMYKQIRNDPYKIFQYTQGKKSDQYSLESCLPFLLHYAHNDAIKSNSQFVYTFLKTILLSYKTKLNKNILLNIENLCVQHS